MMKIEMKCLVLIGLRQMLLIFLASSVPFLLWAQKGRQVDGVVYGHDRSPLQGVSVTIKR